MGRSHLWGECCGRLGGRWPNRWSVFSMYPGIDTSTYRLAYCQSKVRPQYKDPVMSVVISYCFRSAARRWSTSARLVYFIPKSSTTKVKVIGLELCFHRPGVCWTGVYPYGARCFRSRSFAILPAWGRPYMPFFISQYTHPSTAMSRRLYCEMISSGIISNRSFMYS